MEENNNMPKFVTDLSNYLIAIKNYSKLYIDSMIVTVKQFLDFINVHKYKNKYDSIAKFTLNDIRFLSNSDIYSFIFFLAESHYKIGSRVVKVEHLRAFFKYLHDIQHSIFTEPFKQINCEKNIYLKLPNYLTLEQAKKLIRLYSNSTKINQIRDNAMLHVFLNCGLRVSEMSNLNIDDFDFNNNRFTIIGKGNKERTGYLNESTKQALLKYLEVRNTIIAKNKKDNKAMFLSNLKVRICPRAIRLAIQRAYKKVGIKIDGHSVHTLRHTCATIMYRNGIDIKTIQEILGHVQVDTTEIYTHLHDQNVMDAMLEHPMAKFKMADALAFTA